MTLAIRDGGCVYDYYLAGRGNDVLRAMVQELDVSCEAGCCWHHYRHENVVQSVATVCSVPGTMSVTG